MPSSDAGAAPALTLACWHALDAPARDAVRGLAISARQVQYAGPVEAAIRKCEVADPRRLRGLALVECDAVVGFVLLYRGELAPAWAPAGSAVIGGLRIDAACQGRGLGAAAMRALADWVAIHWPDCTGMALRVDDDNAAAIAAYERAGWRETGPRLQGRVGLERTMLRVTASASQVDASYDAACSSAGARLSGAAPGDP